MPRRNGRLRFGPTRREEVQAAFHDLDRPMELVEPRRIKALDVISSRGLWFWIAAALFGVAVGVFIAREPARRR